MATDDNWTVTVQGPNGVKHAVISEKQVELFNKSQHEESPYTSALWLAYCDFWMKIND